MKKIILLFGIFLSFAIIFEASAQMDKQEKKIWKKKAKEYAKNLDALKQLSEDRDRLQSQISGFRSDAENFQSQLSDKDARISQLQDDIAKMRLTLSESKKENNTTEIKSGEAMIDGVVFKVQIGAYKNKDMSQYFGKSENFSGETVDGTQKITLGQFRDYWVADSFKKELRQMGVKDAWIVPYKDGNRVEIKEVMDKVTPRKG